MRSRSSLWHWLRAERRKPKSKFPRFSPRITPARGFEALDRRLVLSADIAVTGFSTDGTNLIAQYSITGDSVGEFNIGIYSSSDGTSLDTLLQSQRVNAGSDRQAGDHTIAIQPNFGSSGGDRFLVVALDSDNEVGELNEYNNSTAMAPGAVLLSDGTLEIQGNDQSNSVSIGVEGDADGDGTVSLSDLLIVKNNFGTSGPGDVNHDGYVGLDDLMMVRNDLGSAKLEVFVDGSRFVFDSVGGLVVCLHGGNDSISIPPGVTVSATVYGGDGDDVLMGGGGNDYLDGGAGNDTYVFSGSGNLGSDVISDSSDFETNTLDFSGLTGGQGISVDLRNANYSPQSVNSQITLALSSATAIKNVIGTSYDDVITGNALDNYLAGGDGNDTIYGDAGNDTIYGGAGDDWLYGDETCGCYSGSDYVYGEAGNDHVYGGPGFDHLSGGTGNDTFDPTEAASEDILDRPVISDFGYQHSVGVYTFTGHVSDDDDLPSTVVYFGDLLAGYTAMIDGNGNFTLSLELTPGWGDDASVWFNNSEGVMSNIALTYVT